MSIDISLDTKNYEVLVHNGLNKIPKFTEFLIDDVATVIEQEMKATVPVKTGALRDSIATEKFGTSARIGTNTGYGLFVDLPTRPHTIRAKGKEAGGADFLRFEINGQIFFRRKVFHTGTKGSFFRRRTLQRSAPRIEQRIKDKLDTLFSDVV